MPAYWIAHVTVTDEDGYGEYRKLAGPAIEGNGGRFLARGGRYEVLEGKGRERHVVVEFPDLESAVRCYNSPEYKEALAHAQPASDRDVVVVEG